MYDRIVKIALSQYSVLLIVRLPSLRLFIVFPLRSFAHIHSLDFFLNYHHHFNCYTCISNSSLQPHTVGVHVLGGLASALHVCVCVCMIREYSYSIN